MKPAWGAIEATRLEQGMKVEPAVNLLGMSRTGYYRWVRGMVDMKTLIQFAARHFGLDILSLTYSREFIYDHHLKEMLARHGIDTVLDIGTNIGGYGAFLRRVGFSGEIHSFEPCSLPFATLSRRADPDPQWRVWRNAFGDTDGEAAINIMAGSELNSFISPTESSEKMTKLS